MKDTAVRIRKDLAFRRVGEELFVVDAASARLHELNGTAAVIWECLAAGQDEDGIVAALAGKFEVDRDAARADCRAFIKELISSGLLKKSV
ncbi:MAG: PqqD family protein [Elusimicrobia bacterium]|nr:PqqD family protein [Elusimicrobiota bacterium]